MFLLPIRERFYPTSLFLTSRSRYTSRFSRLLFLCSALSAFSLTQESVFNFLPSNCLLFKYSLCIEHAETTNIARWTGGTQSTKRERPLRTSVLPDKDHIVLLTEKVTQRIQISPVIMRLCLLANTKNQKLMLVNFVFCGLRYPSVHQKKAFLGALWGWGYRLLV